MSNKTIPTILIVLGIVVFGSLVYGLWVQHTNDTPPAVGVVSLSSASVQAGGEVDYTITLPASRSYTLQEDAIRVVNEQGANLHVNSAQFASSANIVIPRYGTGDRPLWVSTGQKLTSALAIGQGFMTESTYDSIHEYEATITKYTDQPVILDSIGCQVGFSDGRPAGSSLTYVLHVLPKTPAGNYRLQIQPTAYCELPGPAADLPFIVK